MKKDVPFNPNIKDGRCTVGLDVNKSNWANTIEQPPFEAYQVGCGVSFTFGGVRIDPDSGQVIDSDMNPIPGLYAAGELVGGIFYFNYPGGSGPDVRRRVRPHRRHRRGERTECVAACLRHARSRTLSSLSPAGEGRSRASAGDAESA